MMRSSILIDLWLLLLLPSPVVAHVELSARALNLLRSPQLYLVVIIISLSANIHCWT
jgi:hypothetical protein